MQEYQNRNEQEANSPGWKKWLNYHSIVKQIPFFISRIAGSDLYI